MTWFVTFSAIARYMTKANEAQAKFEEAQETMKKAAAELCSKWEGDTAIAFQEEQAKMENWCTQLVSIARTYIQVLTTVIEKYRENEQNLKSKIKI